MNIFILDYDMIKSAQYMCDKHIVKMMTEHNQMLSTAHRFYNGKKEIVTENNRKKTIYKLEKYDDIVYKSSHLNHPCNIWLRKSISNYMWLYKYNLHTIEEYVKRYDKCPKCLTTGLMYILKDAPKNIPDLGLTDFAVAMPDRYKTDCVVESYRNYYLNDKQEIAKWNKTEKPYWWIK